MKRIRGAVSAVIGAGLTGMIWTGIGWAAPVWLQIEARPTLSSAQARARDWTHSLPGQDISGFALRSGWYALALGPFEDRPQAEARRRALQDQNQIPPDSYVTDGARFATRFWPKGGASGAAITPTLPTDTALTGAVAPAPAGPESLSQSRALEAALSPQARRALQAALRWEGVYTGAIDGIFGQGSRTAMAQWQRNQGARPTGVLSSAERRQLLERAEAARRKVGLVALHQGDAGIEIDMPLGLVTFERYDAPFLRYASRDGSGVRALLISRQGDAQALGALYQVMQGLEFVPPEGARRLDWNGFTLEGRSAEVHSFTRVTLQNGQIKGFTLIWPPERDSALAPVLRAMQDSFRPFGTVTLDPTLGKPMAVSHADLVRGTEPHHPRFARSGFYADAQGRIFTALDGLGSCARITSGPHSFTLAYSDSQAGIALLAPEAPLTPERVGTLDPAPLTAGTQLAAAGYSYPQALSAPVLSFGPVLADDTDGGTPPELSLQLRALPGDIGGPVLDDAGRVRGMLIPARTAPPAAPGASAPAATPRARAVPATALIAALQAAEKAPPAAASKAGLDPAPQAPSLSSETLARQARELVARISCWN